MPAGRNNTTNGRHIIYLHRQDHVADIEHIHGTVEISRGINHRRRISSVISIELAVPAMRHQHKLFLVIGHAALLYSGLAKWPNGLP